MPSGTAQELLEVAETIAGILTTDQSILWERRVVEHKTNVLCGFGSRVDGRIGVENGVQILE